MIFDELQMINKSSSFNFFVAVLVVGNPANTNALICAKFAAPTIPFENITAMTRLDENRAKALLANKHDVRVSTVENVIIWGNHR